MTVTRSVSEAQLFAQKISEDYIMPLDDNGSTFLTAQMLIAAMNQSFGEFPQMGSNTTCGKYGLIYPYIFFSHTWITQRQQLMSFRAHCKICILNNTG